MPLHALDVWLNGYPGGLAALLPLAKDQTRRAVDGSVYGVWDKRGNQLRLARPDAVQPGEGFPDGQSVGG